MERDAVSAGVSEIGGLFSTADIRILICYLLSSIKDPVPGRKLADLLHFEGIANCFEVNDSIAFLLNNGQLRLIDEKEDTYVITDKWLHCHWVMTKYTYCTCCSCCCF